jgi:rare lipoprotein A
MRPYTIRGITYYPTVVSVGDQFNGRASWYGPDFHGKSTSSGEVYDMHEMTAAHKTLPMNTIVRVKNQENGKSVVVRINDRGPFVDNRIIDLSNEAAQRMNMVNKGTALVSLEVLGFEKSGAKVIPNQKELENGPRQEIITEFALQIASFSSIEGAIATQKKYDGQNGYKTIIKDISSGDKTVFKVWIKGFQSEAEAKDYSTSTHLSGAFIVKE